MPPTKRAKVDPEAAKLDAFQSMYDDEYNAYGHKRGGYSLGYDPKKAAAKRKRYFTTHPGTNNEYLAFCIQTSAAAREADRVEAERIRPLLTVQAARLAFDADYRHGKTTASEALVLKHKLDGEFEYCGKDDDLCRASRQIQEQIRQWCAVSQAVDHCAEQYAVATRYTPDSGQIALVVPKKVDAIVVCSALRTEHNIVAMLGGTVPFTDYTVLTVQR